jgi:hypothetical protein
MALPSEGAYTTLQADIVTTNTAEFAASVAARDDQAIADIYNVEAVPTFWVYRTSVPPTDYKGPNGLVWTEVDALAIGKARIFEWLTGGLTLPFNAADTGQRQGLADAFGAGTTTRTNLAALGRRPARRIEQLFATGTGSPASPATMAFEGRLTYRDVAHALRGVPLA